MEWRHSVSEWRKINAVHRTAVDRAYAPDANDEYLFYQALVSTWPAEPLDAPLAAEAPPDLVTRMRGYMQKAIKEAKTHTSWFNQGGAYEDAVARFVDTTLRGSAARRFLRSFVPFVRRVSIGGMVNSLAQLVMKVASPGIPDFYQGTELWQLDLTDPDNRRPVDFSARESMMTSMLPWIERAETPASPALAACGCDPDLEAYVGELLSHWPDARIKMFVTACAVRWRRCDPILFLEGLYQPLRAEGAEAAHVIAFKRRLEDRTLIAVVPRLMNHGLPEGQRIPTGRDVWKDTRIILGGESSPTTYRHVFSGARMKADADGSLSAADLFPTLPVALLASEEL
jgi:(1->4)-alpha-D-glucan 1-alpha-D-glucosylmutase